MQCDGSHEREMLRGLAREVRALAEQPVMQERKRLWRAHNALQPTRPLVLCNPEGAWPECVPDAALQCRDPQLRHWERTLRQTLFSGRELCGDEVIEPVFRLPWRVTVGDYGVQVPYTHGDNRGSYVWEPPIRDLARELDALHFRSRTVDRDGTRRDLALAQEVFDGILAVHLYMDPGWTVGLTWEAVKLVGLEPLMLAMYDQPEALHRLMAFLRDEQAHSLDWFERERLLTHNSGANGIGSGGVGYVADLEEGAPGASAGLCERWGFSESQETVGISPAMFDEFVLPYQVPLLERFGLNYYGCCEQLESRIDLVLRHVPRLRRVSVAPKADQEALARKLGGRYVFVRKANPVPVCVDFVEADIRADIRRTLVAAGDQPLELILKDTHTVQGESWRLVRWVALAREEIEAWQQARSRA